MKLYRICTENKNYPDILDYLDKHFPDGYTVIHANGAWQGVREKSLVIEIMQNADMNIQHFVYWLKKHNEQKAVLVQVINIDSWLL
jgi:hypothetical protein